MRSLLPETPISGDPLLFVGGMSRTGTTLLTAALDAHPGISMGTELIPGEIGAPAGLLTKLDEALAGSDGDFSKAGRHLAKNGDYPVGVFLSRCCRAGLTLEETRAVLEAHTDTLSGGVRTWRERLLLAWAMMRVRWRREGTALFGFKLNSGAIEATAQLFPQARFVCIIRDPCDTAHSQLSKGFSDDPGAIARRWNAVVSAYTAFAGAEPERCAVLRYEDLVRAPYRTLRDAFSVLPVAFDPALVSYNTSGAEVLKTDGGSRHPNLEQLRKGFFLDSAGGGRAGLAPDALAVVAEGTAKLAAENGYGNASLVRRPRAEAAGAGSFAPHAIGRIEIARKRTELNRKRCFHIDAYGDLLRPYLDTHEILRLCDLVRSAPLGGRRVLAIRHDVDHDIENAVRIAAWEHERGIRSTYCILHTAWYYGRREGNRYAHSELLVESVERLLELGHEINFHNNLIALALTESVNPETMLANELSAWDARGVPIVGTSMHGDRLCHQLAFRNSELFGECVETRFGGLRRIAYLSPDTGEERALDVGQVSMADHGLEYEAYDVARDIYHTDSGGNLRRRDNTRGRKGFGQNADEGGQIVGVLTHPVWWDLGAASQ